MDRPYFGYYGKTPQLIILLIWATIILSVFVAVSQFAFSYFFGIYDLSYYFALSWQGIQSFYIWQWLTFPFLYSTHMQGLTLSFLIGISFQLLILWQFGSILAQQFGSRSFLFFYFFVAWLSGICALLSMQLLGTYTWIAGLSSIILGIFTAWTMMNPEEDLLFFFLIQLKAKWLLAGLLILSVLFSLSQLDFVDMVYLLSGAFFGYAYAVVAWNLNSPFEFFRPLDQFLRKIVQKLPFTSSSNQKVFDIQTGQPMEDDDLFMDRMLTKIARHGEKSLTWLERRKMREISEKKAKRF